MECTSSIVEGEPEHHRRYRLAWLAHLDPDTPEHCLIDIENEMDSAQNHFTWDEFQEFKKTLPGFVEHWNGIKADLVEELKRMFGMDRDIP